MAVVEQESSRPSVAGSALRALAAALDGVALVALFYLTYIASVWNERPGPQDRWITPPPPVWLLPVTFVVWWLYLTFPTWQGASLGMRAVGLRVVRTTTGGRLGLARSVVRSAALVAFVWALIAVRWWLVPIYGALVFLTAGRRLPHDLLAGSAVVGESPRAGMRGWTSAAAGRLNDMDPLQARALLDDLRRTERGVQADLHVPSVAVLTLGVLGVAGAAVSLAEPFSWWRFGYWAVAAPAGLVLTLVLSALVQRRAGIRRARGWLVAAVLIMVVAAVVGAFSPVGPVLVGLAFLAVAAHERSRIVAVAALAFAVVMGVEEVTGFFGNSLLARVVGSDAVGDHGSTLVEGLVAAILLGVGLVTYGSERAAR